jgi:hypothetical protein
MELKGVAKNPLAIIALFISFMYGAASLILGTSIARLNLENQTTLVWFLVAFPVVIFAAFFFLVIFHHKKLYAPGDFRSDESFLASVETVSPRLKRAEESEAEADDQIEGGMQKPQVGIPKLPKEPNGTTTNVTGPSDADGPRYEILDEAELAESLVADLYQKRLGGLLKRDVRFVSKDGKRFVFDFAIEVRDLVYVGEVKYTRATAIKTSFHGVLGRFFAFDFAKISDAVTFKKIAAIVVEDREQFTSGTRAVNVERRLREIRNEVSGTDVIVEAVTMSQLLKSVRGDAQKD